MLNEDEQWSINDAESMVNDQLMNMMVDIGYWWFMLFNEWLVVDEWPNQS